MFLLKFVFVFCSHTHCLCCNCLGICICIIICICFLTFICICILYSTVHLSYSLSYTLSLLPPSFLFKSFLPLDSSSIIKMEFLLIGLELVVEILWTEVESLLRVEVGIAIGCKIRIPKSCSCRRDVRY